MNQRGALFLADERGRRAEADQPLTQQGQSSTGQPAPASAPLFQVARFADDALALLARICGCEPRDFQARYA